MFGAFDLSDLFQSGTLSSSPSDIIIHPDWNPFNRRYDADIAALILDDEVPYTKYIRPICLPVAESTVKNGFIAGWGQSEDKEKDHENIPKQLSIPIHANEHCFLESVEFTRISSRRTICGGAKNKRGPCRGDSGNGLFVKINNRFYLKGLVSASLTNFGECDVTNYALYTNIEKFIDWIENPTEEISVSVQTTTTRRRGVTSPITRKPIKTTEIPFYYPTEAPEIESCGIMSSATSLIQGGYQSTRETFPWTVAMYLSQGNKHFQYFSTGTLISNRLIVTTGLSVANLDQRTQRYFEKNVDDYRLYFGVNDLSSAYLQPGSFAVDGVEKVILHPSIKHGYPRVSNVGLVKLKSPVQFSRYVAKICLPTEDFNYAEHRSIIAYSAGFGQDDTGHDSPTKKYAKMEIRNEATCENYFSDYLKRTDDKKFFCAGGNGYDSACYRDQPLYLKSNGVWFIRGLIAIAFNAADGRCDLNRPVLYEDVGQYQNWLQNVITNEG